MTQYFVDIEGNYIGGFDGAEPPEGAIEVPEAPNDRRDLWTGSGWQPAPPYPDIPGFFAALGKAIATGFLPLEVYGLGKMILDQPSLADQQAMMLGFAQNPAYTNEQKKILDSLVAAHHLQLPPVSK